MDNKEYDEFMKSLLAQLENSSWDHYMNLCYNVITMFPDQVLSYDEKTAKHKVSSLDKILRHFEEKEDFEKCQKIKELQDQLKK